MLKGTPAKSASVKAAGPAVSGANTALAALKEELFSLEADKLQGRVTDAEYAEQKAALEVVLRRALQRSEPAAEASNMTGPVA